MQSEWFWAVLAFSILKVEIVDPKYITSPY